jgi:hypothetical protein
MNTLDKFKSRFGPAQTDHKRLAEIKLTKERLNKKPHTHYEKIKTPKERPFGGGAMDLIGGRGLVKGIFNLSKKTAGGLPALDILMNTQQPEQVKK